MRSKAFVPLLGLLVAAVLALAVASLRYERDRLMGDFGVSQQETAEQLVADLEQELADLDDDGPAWSARCSAARGRGPAWTQPTGTVFSWPDSRRRGHRKLGLGESQGSGGFAGGHRETPLDGEL